MKSKVEYLKGFAKGIRLDEAEDNNSRMLVEIIKALDEMADELDDALETYDEILSDMLEDDDFCDEDFCDDDDAFFDDEEADDEDDEDDDVHLSL